MYKCGHALFLFPRHGTSDSSWGVTSRRFGSATPGIVSAVVLRIHVHWFDTVRCSPFFSKTRMGGSIDNICEHWKTRVHDVFRDKHVCCEPCKKPIQICDWHSIRWKHPSHYVILNGSLNRLNAILCLFHPSTVVGTPTFVIPGVIGRPFFAHPHTGSNFQLPRSKPPRKFKCTIVVS